MDLEISEMQLSDFEQIEENLIGNFDNFWTPSMLKQELENKNGLSSYYIVAKQNQEIVGFAGITKIIDEINIMNIVVRKDKRGLGIGSNLLEEILKMATRIACKNSYIRSK